MLLSQPMLLKDAPYRVNGRTLTVLLMMIRFKRYLQANILNNTLCKNNWTSPSLVVKNLLAILIRALVYSSFRLLGTNLHKLRSRRTWLKPWIVLFNLFQISTNFMATHKVSQKRYSLIRIQKQVKNTFSWFSIL